MFTARRSVKYHGIIRATWYISAATEITEKGRRCTAQRINEVWRSIKPKRHAAANRPSCYHVYKRIHVVALERQLRCCRMRRNPVLRRHGELHDIAVLQPQRTNAQEMHQTPAREVVLSLKGPRTCNANARGRFASNARYGTSCIPDFTETTVYIVQSSANAAHVSLRRQRRRRRYATRNATMSEGHRGARSSYNVRPQKASAVGTNMPRQAVARAYSVTYQLRYQQQYG